MAVSTTLVPSPKGALQVLPQSMPAERALRELQQRRLHLAIVVEEEQIGPRRYIATLSVVFDRQRAGQFIGDGTSAKSHSAPLLTVPVLYSGGVGQVYEVQGLWQRAWAEYNTGQSAIDYVRTAGTGADTLLLNAGQTGRRSRVWWRVILDQYGADAARWFMLSDSPPERDLEWSESGIEGTWHPLP